MQLIHKAAMVRPISKLRLATTLAIILSVGAGPALAQATALTNSPVGKVILHERVEMRDGVGLETYIMLPKGKGPFPVILERTPYPPPVDDDEQDPGGFESKLLEAGYAVVQQSERGLYWSEGEHKFMARAGEDGYDTIGWIAKQPWSDGNVGTWGCSSTAENQLALIAANHPAHKAAVALSYGAGIGEIGPYREMGNIYRGGALQLFFASWFKYYIGPTGPGQKLQMKFPRDLTREERIQFDKTYDLNVKDWMGDRKLDQEQIKKFYNHLPVANLIKASGGPLTHWDQFARLDPGDAEWDKIAFGRQGQTFGVPTIWGATWYDISVGPNLYLYDYAKSHIARGRPDNEQFLLIAPGQHCDYKAKAPNFVVGEMPVGDASYDYSKRYIDFFDWKLKGKQNGADKEARVQYWQFGDDKWMKGDKFPVTNPTYRDLYFSSTNGANSRFGDGALLEAPGAGRAEDMFVYDPKRPVQSLGGGTCCMRGLPLDGAYDQAPVEARHDVLVFSTPPLKNDLVVRGPVQLELYVGTDALDTDFTAKLVDVAPDGTAYNLDDTIFRLRYRNSWSKPELARKGEVYKLVIPPMFTATRFKAGHRIRVQISSSNFPRYERNLNTGGKNAEETTGVVARNVLYHSAKHPSRIRLSVVKD